MTRWLGQQSWGETEQCDKRVRGRASAVERAAKREESGGKQWPVQHRAWMESMLLHSTRFSERSCPLGAAHATGCVLCSSGWACLLLYHVLIPRGCLRGRCVRTENLTYYAVVEIEGCPLTGAKADNSIVLEGAPRNTSIVAAARRKNKPEKCSGPQYNRWNL